MLFENLKTTEMTKMSRRKILTAKFIQTSKLPNEDDEDSFIIYNLNLTFNKNKDASKLTYNTKWSNENEKDRLIINNSKDMKYSFRIKNTI